MAHTSVSDTRAVAVRSPLARCRSERARCGASGAGPETMAAVEVRPPPSPLARRPLPRPRWRCRHPAAAAPRRRQREPPQRARPLPRTDRSRAGHRGNEGVLRESIQRRKLENAGAAAAMRKASTSSQLATARGSRQLAAAVTAPVPLQLLAPPAVQAPRLCLKQLLQGGGGLPGGGAGNDGAWHPQLGGPAAQ